MDLLKKSLAVWVFLSTMAIVGAKPESVRPFSHASARQKRGLARRSRKRLFCFRLRPSGRVSKWACMGRTQETPAPLHPGSKPTQPFRQGLEQALWASGETNPSAIEWRPQWALGYLAVSDSWERADSQSSAITLGASVEDRKTREIEP